MGQVPADNGTSPSRRWDKSRPTMGQVPAEGETSPIEQNIKRNWMKRQVKLETGKSFSARTKVDQHFGIRFCVALIYCIALI